MKFLSLTLALLIFSILPLLGQISFEKGYIIDNTGEKIDCLIKDKQWKDNPTEFNYKLSDDASILTGNIENISEFGINSTKTKYVRFKVEIDRSSRNIDLLSRVKDPEFKTETLFLKTLVEGEASLFYYTSPNIVRFFYSVGSKEIEQLIYKQYAIDGIRIQENARFRQQIFTTLNCGEQSELKYLKYKRKDLSKVFVNYNKCINAEYAIYNKNNTKVFHLSVKPGVDFKSFSLFGPTNRSAEFGSQTNFRMSLSGEFILGFNKNKWSVIIEPTYQYYSGFTDLDQGFLLEPISAEVNYKGLGVPIGIRHYFYLSKESKVFLNAFLDLTVPIESEVRYGSKILNDSSIAPTSEFGVGYSYKRFSGEFRYASGKDILTDYVFWFSSYNGFSLILGYQIF